MDKEKMLKSYHAIKEIFTDYMEKELDTDEELERQKRLNKLLEDLVGEIGNHDGPLDLMKQASDLIVALNEWDTYGYWFKEVSELVNKTRDLIGDLENYLQGEGLIESPAREKQDESSLKAASLEPSTGDKSTGIKILDKTSSSNGQEQASNADFSPPAEFSPSEVSSSIKMEAPAAGVRRLKPVLHSPKILSKKEINEMHSQPGKLASQTSGGTSNLKSSGDNAFSNDSMISSPASSSSPQKPTPLKKLIENQGLKIKIKPVKLLGRIPMRSTPSKPSGESNKSLEEKAKEVVAPESTMKNSSTSSERVVPPVVKPNLEVQSFESLSHFTPVKITPVKIKPVITPVKIKPVIKRSIENNLPPMNSLEDKVESVYEEVKEEINALKASDGRVVEDSANKGLSQAPIQVPLEDASSPSIEAKKVKSGKIREINPVIMPKPVKISIPDIPAFNLEKELTDAGLNPSDFEISEETLSQLHELEGQDLGQTPQEPEPVFTPKPVKISLIVPKQDDDEEEEEKSLISNQETGKLFETSDGPANVAETRVDLRLSSLQGEKIQPAEQVNAASSGDAPSSAPFFGSLLTHQAESQGTSPGMPEQDKKSFVPFLQSTSPGTNEEPAEVSPPENKAVGEASSVPSSSNLFTSAIESRLREVGQEPVKESIPLFQASSSAFSTSASHNSIGNSTAIKPLGSDVDINKLPETRDGLSQSLIALEGKRYSLERAKNELRESLKKGKINEKEYQQKLQLFKQELDSIAEKILELRDKIHGMGA
ncbi:MAG: hypothetical protein ACTSVI_14230 [Promethearchaeota archaeon]